MAFYSAWLLLHFIQAFHTELFDDEAYYWVYSKFPEWGYFDHPPMIALLIKAGYSLFQNELGVRLFAFLFTTAALFVTELLLERKNPFLFYAICGSLALAQIGGLIAAPDSPLMLFVALFFYAYKKFTERMTLLNTVWVGLVIAAMFYTKYHALLILLFTALSNLKLLKHWQPYAACLIALVLFLPHIYWQYENGYPSLLFHLFERNAPGYDPLNTLEFVGGQMLIAGPLTGWLLIFAALRYKTTSDVERALRFVLIGFYAFFLLSTFRGNAEANWTIPAFIGLIVLSHQYLLDRTKLRHLLYRFLPLTITLVFIGRVIMFANVPPAWWIFKDEFHGNKVFAKQIHTRAKDLPVVFLDTYQKPSKYWYYAGDTALALNTPTYRRNNYNYWPIEENYIGRPAYVFGQYNESFDDVFILRSGEKNGGRFVPNYFSFSKVMIDNVETEQVEKTLSLRFTIQTPVEYLKYFQQAPYDSSSVYMAIYKSDSVFQYINTGLKVSAVDNPRESQAGIFPLPLAPGTYNCKLAISTCIPGKPSLNSSRFTIDVR
ncbi:MAG: glycosyltransferase family 39 protein [Chitinophagaceae bacterium]|nr:glycosyltransferase family 39 protein [Chitinophagaceae bacterium]